MSSRHQGLHICLFGTELCLYLHISIYLSIWTLTYIYSYPHKQKQTVTLSHAASNTRQLCPSCTELACWSLVQSNVVSAETSLLLSAVSPSYHLHLSDGWVLVPLSTCPPLYTLHPSAWLLNVPVIKPWDSHATATWGGLSEKGMSTGHWLG